MNWDRGFKRLYIAFSILFFLGSLFFSYDRTERYKEVPCTKDSGPCFSHEKEDGRTSKGHSLANRTFSERLPDAFEPFVVCVFLWIIISALWFLTRWVLLGFKKTTSARNWPEGPDE